MDGTVLVSHNDQFDEQQQQQPLTVIDGRSSSVQLRQNGRMALVSQL
jgi:hypothetical protein